MSHVLYLANIPKEDYSLCWIISLAKPSFCKTLGKHTVHVVSESV